jgi:hypothetical protein
LRRAERVILRAIEKYARGNPEALARDISLRWAVPGS